MKEAWKRANESQAIWNHNCLIMDGKWEQWAV